MARREVTKRRGSNSKPRGLKIFRRGLTIIGTTSEVLRGSSNESASLQSPRTKAHHLSQKRNKIARLLLVILATVALLAFLVSQFSAEPVVVVNNQNSSPEFKDKYKTAINDYMKNNPASRLQFLMNDQALSSYVSSEISEVKSIRQIDDGDSLGQTVFEVETRLPLASWVIGDKKYYVDAQGVAFEMNYFEEPSVEIVDDSGISSEEYGVLASNSLLGFVGRVVSLSTQKGIEIERATLPPDKTRQVDFKIKDYKPYIKMAVDRPANNQVEDMSRAVKYMKGQGTIPEYIDVRVSGKAFYR
jgi:hypothetical protein